VAIADATIFNIISPYYSLVASFWSSRLRLVSLLVSFVCWFFVWNTLYDAFLNFVLVSRLIVVQFRRILSRLSLSLLWSR
jgi:hypothetical protein